MYCPNCGKPLRDGASFCGFCGKDLADRIKKTAPVHEVQITPSAPKVRITSSVPVSAVKFKFNKKLLLIPLILVLAVGMGTAANSMVQKPVLSCDAIEVRHPVTSKMSVTAKQTGGKLTNLVMIMTFETTSSLYADSTYLDYSGVINSYLNNNPDTRSVINVKWDKNTRSGNYTSTMTATLN
ncbi:MAG: zinc ribbon domain-containing protein, partial [Solobacterium sp.]|nr:zinc ribbon domain-containing protein [Solobacterium sp.]